MHYLMIQYCLLCLYLSLIALCCLQEYISTMGADFIQYMIGDVVAAPPRVQHLYSEKVGPRCYVLMLCYCDSTF